MGKEIKVRLIMRWNSTEGWSALNSEEAILAKGEIGLEYISGSALPKMKIGTGNLSWNNLPYFETKLPENYTWGKLRGTTLQTSTSKTENLELTKPGFLDTVNIAVLNKNFEKIDIESKFQSDKMKEIGERLSFLISNYFPSYPEYDEENLEEVPAEIADARIRFKNSEQETKFLLIGDLIRQIDTELQEAKEKINSIANTLTLPTSLKLNEEGQIYLIDNEGNQIGNSVVVKDIALENQVGILETQNTVLDAQIQNNSSEINNIKNKIDKLPSSFPNNLIYEENKLYLAVGNNKIESSMVEIVGGGGGGGTAYRVSLTTPSTTISKPFGEQIIVTYTYTSVDKETGIPDGNGRGELIINGASIFTFSAEQGKENPLDVTEYLQKGTNTVIIKVTNSEGTSRTVEINVNVIALIVNISESFQKLDSFPIGIMNVPFSVQTTQPFTVYILMSKQGELAPESKIVYEQSFAGNSSGITSHTAVIRSSKPGAYTLELYVISEGTKSESLFFGRVFYDRDSSDSYILMLPEKNSYKYGETISFYYLIYDPTNSTLNSIFSVYTKENYGESSFYTQELRPLDQTQKQMTVQQYPTGEVIFEIARVNKNVKNIILYNIDEPDADLSINREGLIFEFDPIGKTNSINAGVWKCINNITGEEENAEFSGIDWGELDGWYIKKDENGNLLEEQTMLRILPGGSMIIPFYLFNENVLDSRNQNFSGYTIEIELGTQNVTDYDSLIIDAFDDSSSEIGLRVYSQIAELKTQSNTISAQFKEDERIRLTFTLEPDISNKKFISIYINGILCGVKSYTSDMTEQKEKQKIKIGAETSGIDVYFIRAYNRILNDEEQLRSFCLDRPTYSDKVSAILRNDILNSYAYGDPLKKITPASLKGTVPYMVISCPKLPEIKDDSQKYPGTKIEFFDPYHSSRNFSAENCTISVQGTSSAVYPVKNFKIKLDKTRGIKDEQDNTYEGFYFRGQENSQPTKVFCLKADYASSESANNVMLVDYYNETCPYRTPAQMYEREHNKKDPNNKDEIGTETTRHGVHGEPIALFWRNTSTLSQEIYFQGKYNFNDDKDAENVFGYVDILPEDDYNIQCWEFRNNNNGLCLFDHELSQGDAAWFNPPEGSTEPPWLTAFERRFPEQEDTTSREELIALRRMVDWVASTNRKDTTNDQLPKEKRSYLKTLDKSFVKSKENNYYELKGETFVKFIPLKGEDAYQLSSYSSQIRTPEPKKTITKIELLANAQNFSMLALRPLDLIFEKLINPETQDISWNLSIKQILTNERGEVISNSAEPIFLNNIPSDKLSSEYFINVLDDRKSFAIKCFENTGWTSDLYEYHEYDNDSYRLAKFKTEFEDYFILDAMAYYYAFTETVLLMDNRAKNMFLASFDIGKKPLYNEDGSFKGYENNPATYGHWAPTPYDMDSALGINNEGELKYGYHLEDDGRDGKVFTGQDSVLWNNFRDCFQDEISTMYKKIRGQVKDINGEKPFSYEALSSKMAKHQETWPEIIWNIDQQIKYLQPFPKKNYLPMLQGNKRTQRDFWLYNAFKYRDSKYSTGDAENNHILLRINHSGIFNLVPYSNIYTRVRFGNALDLKKRTFKNETASFSTDGISSIYDLETYIYSADRLTDIGDLSDFQVGLCDFSSASKIKEILLGRREEGYENTHLTSFTAGSSTVLEKIDLSNCVNLEAEINLNSYPILKTFLAKGSKIKSVSFARGAQLTTCHLPNTLPVLKFLDLSQLNRPRRDNELEEKDWGLEIETNNEGKYNFSGIYIENSNYVPFFEIIKNSPQLNYVRLTGINWETNLDTFIDFYDTVKDLKGYDDNGSLINNSVVTGEIHLPADSEISPEELLEINDKFPNLTIYIGGNAKFVLKFWNYNREKIYSYIASKGDKPLDPTVDEIDGLDRQEVLRLLNSKPAIDSEKYPEDPEEEVDTKYFFIGWDGFPEKVTSSNTFSPVYQTQFLVKFFPEEGNDRIIAEDIWVIQGEDVPDPRDLSENYIQHKEPNAQFSFVHSGWNHSLLNIQKPLNYRPIFSETINHYTVNFYTNLPEPIAIISNIPYGETISDIDESLKKYYIDGDKNQPSDLYTFDKWNSTTPGVEGLTITPLKYQKEPIVMEASFIYTGNRNDTPWEYIALVAAAGNRDIEITAENCIKEEDIGKKIYRIALGTEKDVYINYNNINYVITMEVVALNFDKLVTPDSNYNGGQDRAAFTFLTKNIPFTRQINADVKKFKFPVFNETGEIVSYLEASGFTAGGWENSDIRDFSKGDFLTSLISNNSGLNEERIREVEKIGDIGRPTDLFDGFKNQNQTSYDRIWIPSATELNLDADPGTDLSVMDKQSSVVEIVGDKIQYAHYPWFTTNETRIKFMDNVSTDYWTRTHSMGHEQRFLYVTEEGSVDTLSRGRYIGFVFGFCI